MTAQKTISAKVSEETAQNFEQLFRESGATSRDEFFKDLFSSHSKKSVSKVKDEKSNPGKIDPLQTLMDQKPPAQAPEPEVIEVEKLVEVERKMENNEILLKLHPGQMFILKEIILSKSDFAEKENEMIDKIIQGKKPFLYFGNLFNPEFIPLWQKSRPLSNEMNENEMAEAIKANIASFVLNIFTSMFINGQIDYSGINSENLSAFMKDFQENKTEKS